MRLVLRAGAEERDVCVLGARGPCAAHRLQHPVVLRRRLALLVGSPQLRRPLQQFKRVVVLQLLQTARVKGRFRECHFAEEHLLPLLRVVVVFEHLVEHEVEQLLVRDEQLNKFLAFDLRKLFDFFGRACLDDTEVRL